MQTTYTLSLPKGANFTPASLMQRIAKEKRGVDFKCSHYGEYWLKIDDIKFKFDHWEITEVGDLLRIKICLKEVYR